MSGGLGGEKRRPSRGLGKRLGAAERPACLEELLDMGSSSCIRGRQWTDQGVEELLEASSSSCNRGRQWREQGVEELLKVAQAPESGLELLDRKGGLKLMDACGGGQDCSRW